MDLFETFRCWNCGSTSSAAGEALALMCLHCNVWVGTNTRALADEGALQEAASEMCERLARHPGLQDRLADLAETMATALAQRNRDHYERATQEYYLLWSVKNPDLQPDLSAEERIEQARLSSAISVIMVFDPVIAAAQARLSAAVMALGSGEEHCLRAARELLAAAVETQERLREHPDLAGVYSAGAPSEVYARNQLRSTLAAMPQLSPHVVASVHREVLEALPISPEATACPGCGASLSRGQIDPGECPYCSTSFYTPNGGSSG